MATIKQRRKKFSVIYWYLNEYGVRKQKWDTVNTVKEAKARKTFIEYYQQENGYTLVPLIEQYAEQRFEAKEQATDPNPDITVKEFLVIFVNLYGVAKWSPTTFSGKVGTINNYINPYLGDLKVTELTTKRLTQYYNDLLSVKEVPRNNGKVSGKCLQPANIKKIHDLIRCALNQAIKWEYLDTKMRNPATLATLPKYVPVKRKVWSVDTFKKAIQNADDEILILCMHLAFSCSMRIGEICGLTWDKLVIDEESIEKGYARLEIEQELNRANYEVIQKLNNRDIIRIFPTLKPHSTTRLVLKVPKTDSSFRTVWIPKILARMIVEYKKNQDELKEFLGDAYKDYNLVIALDNGNPVESRVVRERFQELCQMHDLEIVKFHSLRHLSTKYKLKLTNGDIKSVQGDTGHAEAEMVTDVYAEIVDEDRRKNAEKMNDDFYSSLNVVEEKPNVKINNDSEKLLVALLRSLDVESLSSETKETLLNEILQSS